MSRQIDFSQPLSDEDREYLHMRGEHARVEQMDRDFPPVDDEDDEDEADEVEDYATWKKAELVAEATRRELDASGNVDVLRARLMESDAAEDDEDSE